MANATPDNLSAPGRCQHCGSEMAETGAPIWEIYCPSQDCTVERDAMFARVRADIRRRKMLDDAAPSLLAAANEFLTRFEAGERVDTDHIADMMRAAIARAGGDA